MESKDLILADEPELLALAQLSALPASKIAAGFNDPSQFFNYLTLEELARLQAACERLAAFQVRLSAKLDIYANAARELLEMAADAS